MARRKFNGGCAITCDVKRDGCHERFTTYSFPSVARKQAKAIGWTRPSGKKFQGESEELVLSLKTIDVCPQCFATAPRYVKPKKPKAPRKKKAA